MHELTIASGIVSAVSEELEKSGAGRARALLLRVGDLSGVNRESLRFCLSAIQPGTLLEGLEVRVERVPAVLRCPSCGEVPCGDRFDAICPNCHGPIEGVSGGRDLVVELETEE